MKWKTMWNKQWQRKSERKTERERASDRGGDRQQKKSNNNNTDGSHATAVIFLSYSLVRRIRSVCRSQRMCTCTSWQFSISLIWCVHVVVHFFFSPLLAIGQLTIKLKNNDTLQQRKNVYLKTTTTTTKPNKNAIPKGVEPHTQHGCVYPKYYIVKYANGT